MPAGPVQLQMDRLSGDTRIEKSGAEGATYRRNLNRLWESLRQMDREDITVLKVSYLIIQLSPPKFCILI